MTQASNQFEDLIAGILVQDGNVVIRPNSPSRKHIGFVGRRKPDLLSLSPELQITIWELKTAVECNRNDNASRTHIWFRHPSPEHDYISEIRQTFTQNTSISTGAAGWCIVLKGELAYWLTGMGTEWRHPLTLPEPRTVLAGVAAPIIQQEYILAALQNLGWQNWESKTQSGVTMHCGPIPEEHLSATQEQQRGV